MVINCVADSFLTKPLGHRYYHYQEQESLSYPRGVHRPSLVM